VRFEDVTLSFSGITAIDDVSFEVYPGELYAIIGPNGAGKTSTFNCISGVYRPTQGRVEVAGQDVARLEPHEVTRLGVARTFQNVELFPMLTTLENLLVGRHVHYTSSWFGDGIFLGRARREEVANRAKVEEIIEFLNLERYRDMPASFLAYGVQKRIELGRALVMEPTLLLLDEPAAGMNQEETEDVARYLLDVQEELDVTQILVEHDMGVVMDLADRVTVLDFGRKIAEGARGGPARPGGHPGLPRLATWPRRWSDERDDERHRWTDAGAAHPPRLAAGPPGPPRPRPARRPGAAGEAARGLGGALLGRLPRRGAGHRHRDAGRRGPAGDHVAILSENREEWVFADLAAQAIGARSVGVYPTNPEPEVAYILSHSGSVLVVCEDQEQVDKVVAIRDQTPTVRRSSWSTRAAPAATSTTGW
jgi:branched-chain amino acid transport system ATP-binding protein